MINNKIYIIKDNNNFIVDPNSFLLSENQHYYVRHKTFADGVQFCTDLEKAENMLARIQKTARLNGFSMEFSIVEETIDNLCC